MTTSSTRKDGNGSERYACSFCRKLQDEVRRLIAGPSRIYICNECVDRCQEILNGQNPEASSAAKQSTTSSGSSPKRQSTPARSQNPGQTINAAWHIRSTERLRNRTRTRQAGHKRRRLQPLQTHVARRGTPRPGATEDQHPPRWTHRFRQDSPGADVGQDPGRSVRNSRRHLSDRGRLRWRGCGEHTSSHHPGCSIRHGPRRTKGSSI